MNRQQMRDALALIGCSLAWRKANGGTYTLWRTNCDGPLDDGPVYRGNKQGAIEWIRAHQG